MPFSRSPVTTTAAHLRPERPQRVRAAGPARADRPRVRPAGQPGDEDADRDRAGEVGDEHQDDRPEHDRGVHRARSSVGPGRPRRAGPARRPESSIRAPGAARLRVVATPRVPSTAMTHLPTAAARRAAAAALRGTLTHGRRLVQRLRSRRARRRAPAATRRPSGRPSSGSRSPSSTRTRSAGRASTAAASRPRRCSSRPPSPSGSATPRTTA